MIHQAKQYVEIFHLLFLAQLSQKLDKQLYALKGGCNLRFYFNSIRYSEDIDLDVQIIQMNTLQNKIDRILGSPAFIKILKSYDITLQQISQHKQSQSTQRWKLALKTPATAMPIPTKIEFSWREMGSEIEFRPVNRDIISEYSMVPILSNHYTKNAMWEQKIQALAYRSQTQARDIFDLYLLLDKDQNKNTNLTEDEISLARNNIGLITYDDYKSQVVAYLLPEHQDQFDSVAMWNIITEDVGRALL